MRILWTLFKVIVGLAIAIPVCLIAASLAFGVLGALIGLAFIALRLALLGLVGYGMFRLGRHLLAPKAKPAASVAHELPSVDPYYEAAMRELDAEFGRTERN